MRQARTVSGSAMDKLEYYNSWISTGGVGVTAFLLEMVNLY